MPLPPSLSRVPSPRGSTPRAQPIRRQQAKLHAPRPPRRSHMPSELLEGGIVSHATDAYSFGVLLWEVSCRTACRGVHWCQNHSSHPILPHHHTSSPPNPASPTRMQMYSSEHAWAGCRIAQIVHAKTMQRKRLRELPSDCPPAYKVCAFDATMLWLPLL